MHQRLGLVGIAVCALLVLGACGPQDRSPLAPVAMSTPAEPALLGPADSAAPSHLVLFADGISDPWFLFQEYGLEVFVSLITESLVGVSGASFVLDLLELDPRVLAIQTNGATAITEPSDLTMAFFEGEFEDVVPRERSEFTSLLLDRVHGRARGDGIRVAVLDTGVDLGHPYLQDRLEIESTFLLGSPLEIADGIDDDDDGEIDEAFGHGTHVTGIIATVAPGATIVPIRVLNSDGIGTAYELAVGIRAAIDRDVDVINLSVSIDQDAGVVEELLRRAHEAGITIVAAAGNTGGVPTFPAAYDFVLGAAATTLECNVLADFSARGALIEMAAPGTAILSSYPGGAWAEASGSSMAAAVLSGSAAVVRSSAAHVDASRAHARLTSTASAIEPTGSVEHGVIQLFDALIPMASTTRNRYQPTTVNGAH